MLCCSCAGGLLGPYMVGYLVEVLGGFSMATVIMGMFLIAAGTIIWLSAPYTLKGYTPLKTTDKGDIAL